MASDQGAVLHLVKLLDCTDPDTLSVDDLTGALRFCALSESASDVIEARDLENLVNVVNVLLGIALEGHADIDEHPIDDKRARLAMRTLVNAANRSDSLRRAIPPDCLPHWRALLRVDSLRLETFASLVSFAPEMHKIFSLHADYTKLLGELALLWEICTDEQRSWITALFSIHLEKDYAFLAHAFADFECDQYSAVLNCTETIMDSSETNTVIKIHPNNIQFCADLIERILFDFGEGKIDHGRKFLYIEWMIYLVEIIASASLRRPVFDAQLHNKVDATRLVRQIIDSLIANPVPIQRTADRPNPSPAQRRMTVLNSVSLSSLSDILLECPVEKRADLKCAAVRAIGNLSGDSPENRLEAGRADGVLLVLSCANLGPNDRPFIVQWAISSLRQMVLGCPENQQVIADMDQKPTGVIDRKRLLNDLGLECDIDSEGRVLFRKQ